MNDAIEFYTRARIVADEVIPYDWCMRLRVRELRQAKGWSQQRLADEAGLRQATISKVESHPDKTEIVTLVQIAEGLGCHVGDLVEGLPKENDLRSIAEMYLRLPQDDKAAVARHMEGLAARSESAA